MRVLVLGTILLALVVPSDARACNRVVPKTPKEDLAEADGAFYGTVVDREILDEGNPDKSGDEYVNYTFRIDIDYKGNLPPELPIGVPVSSAGCGFDLEKG